jgi:hypothetical protein
VRLAVITHWRRKPTIIVACLFMMLTFIAAISEAKRPRLEAADTGPVSFLPIVHKPEGCPVISSNQYSSGTAFQFDLDNPVRPAYNHADKNLDLRGYQLNPDPNLRHDLVDYGSDDPTQPPQLATLFSPARVPAILGLYQVNEWNWSPSPNPGNRGAPITIPEVTTIGLAASFGETLHVPQSGYDIGGGKEVILIYADENTVALRYTREDSAGSAGYLLHIDNICTDPNLLASYNALDNPSGPRYQYIPPNKRPYSYNLPNLSTGKVLGTVRYSEVIVAIVDTGRFWDPRSCDEWWQIRPGYGSCH